MIIDNKDIKELKWVMIKKFWKKLQENKLYQVIFCVTFVSIMFVVDFFAQRHIYRTVVEIIDDDFSWVFQVEEIEKNDKNFVLKGWAFQLGANSTEGYEIILHNLLNDKLYYPEMEYSVREDVDDYFKCEFDYSKSGFSATISVDKKNISNGKFEILLRPDDTRQVYKTGIYLVDGHIQFVHPDKYFLLDVNGSELSEIVNEGIVRVWRPDYGMYVYQYKGDLYWIADESYAFVDDDGYIQYQMNTTQIEKLPQDRLDNNWLWSNLGFTFSTKELTNLNTEKYRVAKASLPTEYSITNIYTGNYDQKWIWRQDFRPWYDLK